MSGQSIDNGKKKSAGFYIPLALELFIGFLPVLLLGGWYISRTLKTELLKFESGLSWITVCRLMEMETERFNEMMGLETVDTLDLAELSSEELLPGHLLGFSKALLFGIREDEVHSLTQQDDEQIRYIYYDENHELMELNTDSGSTVKIEEGSDYYNYAAMALGEKVPDRSLMETSYTWNNTKYYSCFMPAMTPKPVRFRDILLSDGSKGSCVLICGQQVYTVTEKMVNFHVVRATLIIYLALLIVVIFICLGVSWALRGPRRIHKSIRSMRKSNYAPFENDRTFQSSAIAPEIKELTESFQLMFLSIQEYQGSISSIRELYEPLLPAALLDLFGHGDIREIRPGDTTRIRGTKVDLYLEEDAKNSGTNSERNCYLKKLLDLLSADGLIVAELDADHISAVRCDADTEYSEHVSRDLLPKLYEADRAGTGLMALRAEITEGEFLLTLTGIPEHMAIRMEKIS